MDKSFITVLLIEDNPADIILLREALAENPLTGFRLETAERLSTGLQWLREHPCDVVLLDLGLPDSQVQLFECCAFFILRIRKGALHFTGAGDVASDGGIDRSIEGKALFEISCPDGKGREAGNP